MTRLAQWASLKWLLLLLSIMPAAFFAYLGHFSRLMGDDYSYFSTVIRLGIRDNFRHWWNSWHGSYSFIIAFEALAPLGPEFLPPLMPAALIVTYAIGLAWIISHLMRGLGLRQHRSAIAIVLGALGAFATVIAFHTEESFYHFTAALRHTLPVGILLVLVGLALEVAPRIRSSGALILAASGFALLCFIAAGLSELYALVQLVSLLLVTGVCMFIGGPLRRTRAGLFAAGLAGSALSLIVQLAAPGSAIRVEQTATLDYTNPVRALPALAIETIELSYAVIGNRGSILGFLLLLVAGLAVAVFVCRREQAQGAGQPLKIAAGPMILGFLLQLLLIPSNWLSGGDQATVIASAEGAVTLLRCLHILFALIFFIAIWRRRQLEAWLNGRDDGASQLSAVVLLAAFLLLAGAQHEAYHARASAYLFVSALAILAVLGALLQPLQSDLGTRRAYLAAMLSLGLGFAGVALPIAVGLYSLGYVFERTLAFSSLSQVMIGLFWGAYLGFLIGRARLWARPGPRLVEWICLVGILLAAALVIGGVFLPRLRLIQEFRAFAREWDARHARIVRLRSSGERDVVVAPYSFDMTAYVSSRGLPMGKTSTYFYDLDSVTVSEP